MSNLCNSIKQFNVGVERLRRLIQTCLQPISYTVREVSAYICLTLLYQRVYSHRKMAATYTDSRAGI